MLLSQIGRKTECGKGRKPHCIPGARGKAVVLYLWLREGSTFAPLFLSPCLTMPGLHAGARAASPGPRGWGPEVLRAAGRGLGFPGLSHSLLGLRAGYLGSRRTQLPTPVSPAPSRPALFKVFLHQQMGCAVLSLLLSGVCRTHFLVDDTNSGLCQGPRGESLALPMLN